MPSLSIDRERIVQFCREHGIAELSLFGSVLRPDFRPDSDVDVLVEFEPHVRASRAARGSGNQKSAQPSHPGPGYGDEGDPLCPSGMTWPTCATSWRVDLGYPGFEGSEMTIEELLRTKRHEILRVAAQYGAGNVRVFGSVARGEADDRSDIDMLVEMEPGRSLLDLGGLQFELERLLGRPVDVVTERGLKARIRDRVLREAMPV